MAELSAEEYAKRFSKLYQTVMNLRHDEDFLINEVQMRKFFEVCEFFGKATSESDTAKLEPIKLIPREEHGGVTATFIVFDIYGDSMKEFQKIVQYLSAFTIDATNECEVCVSVTVPNVFVPKA